MCAIIYYTIHLTESHCTAKFTGVELSHMQRNTVTIYDVWSWPDVHHQIGAVVARHIDIKQTRFCVCMRPRRQNVSCTIYTRHATPTVGPRHRSTEFDKWICGEYNLSVFFVCALVMFSLTCSIGDYWITKYWLVMFSPTTNQSCYTTVWKPFAGHITLTTKHAHKRDSSHIFETTICRSTAYYENSYTTANQSFIQHSNIVCFYDFQSSTNDNLNLNNEYKIRSRIRKK